MKNLMPLMQREWLQHRFAWALLVLVPLAVSLLLLGVGQIDLDDDMSSLAPRDLSLLLAALTAVISVAVLFLILGVTALFTAIGSPRRDHGDRSIEFWLSLPSGHAESLLAPMLVHLLLVPAAAVLAGLVVSLPVSMMVVGRVVGLGEWLSLPWGGLVVAMGAMAMRLLAGLPMAVAWLLPLLLAAMLANAFFRRWGLPLLVVMVGLASFGLNFVFGQPLLLDAIGSLGAHAATSLAGASAHQGFTVETGAQAHEALAALPRWVLGDLIAALRQLLQPAFLGACAVSAVFFAGLVAWRQRLASVA
jgi:ABC-2 type transport system permease protein